VTLRPYQTRAILELRKHIKDRPILCQPTGSGKTVVATEIIRLAKVPVLFLVHRRELVYQAASRFDAGIIMAGVIPTDAPVQIASIQTLARRRLPPAGLLIVDECHHATSPSWTRVINNYDTRIGLTATPFRLDGKGLGSLFGRIVTTTTVAELCEQGFLVEPTVYSHPIPSTKDVRLQSGDYVVPDLVALMNTPKLLGNIVSHWKKYGGKRTVVFAINIEHSKNIIARFQQEGIPAEHADGTTPKAERAAILGRVESGETLVISNCGLWGEGVDIPALEVAILARPTKSLCLHLQQIGRIMRAAPGKEGALVLDHAGNSLEHGTVTDEIEYSLEDKVRRAGSDPLGFKYCDQCYRLVPRNTKICPECGFAFDVPEDGAEARQEKNTAEARGELVKFRSLDNRRETYKRLIAKANDMGYRMGWARHRFKTQFGSWPRFDDIEADYLCPQHEYEEKRYGWKVVVKCSRCGASRPSTTAHDRAVR